MKKKEKALLYTIRPGDSLSQIARDILGDVSRWPEIAVINRIKNPNLIYAGQILKLPQPVKTKTLTTTHGITRIADELHAMNMLNRQLQQCLVIILEEVPQEEKLLKVLKQS